MAQITIENLLCTRTGTYADQYYRPLTTHVDADLINRFREDTNEGSSISNITLSGVAGDILRPSATAKSMVNIDNGWGEERLAFILVVHEGSQFSVGNNTVRVIHGYTDRYEPTLSGLIPEDTRFYFNSEVIYRTTVTERRGMIKEDLIFLGANQILRGQSESERDDGHALDLITLRPEDVFSYHMTEGIQKRTMRAHNINGRVVTNFNENGRRINSIDNSSRFTRGNELKLNRRNDISSPVYLTNLMHGYRAVVNDPNARSFDATDLYGSALRKTENSPISSNAFLRTLRTRSANLIRHGYVTFGEMLAEFPELDNVTVLPDPRARVSHNRFDRHNSAGWHRRDEIGVAMSMLKQTLPSIASCSLLQTVGFSVDSDPVEGYIISPYPDAVSGLSDKVDLRKAFTEFSDRITDMLLNPLTHNGEQAISLDIMMDLVGSTEIAISIDNSEVVESSAPTYCDGLDSAMLDEDDSNLIAVAKDINHIIQQGTDWSDRTGVDSGHFDNSWDDEPVEGMIDSDLDDIHNPLSDY